MVGKMSPNLMLLSDLQQSLQHSGMAVILYILIDIRRGNRKLCKTLHDMGECGSHVQYVDRVCSFCITHDELLLTD